MKNWSVKTADGTQHGPLPTSEVIRALLTHSIPPTAWVSEPAADTWQPISTRPEFAPHCPNRLRRRESQAPPNGTLRAVGTAVAWAVLFGAVAAYLLGAV